MKPGLKNALLNAWEVAEVILISLATVFFIRTFIAQPFLVSGASMETTFKNGDYLLIDELTYRFREPERGEVIVFRYPGDEHSFFIKRIIGLPGETVRIQNNTIKVTPATGDPIIISEPYLSEQTKTLGDKNVTLGEGEYFVMGDNRGNSFDSRNWGPLTESHIVGLARVRVFPLNQLNLFQAPVY